MVEGKKAAAKGGNLSQKVRAPELKWSLALISYLDFLSPRAVPGISLRGAASTTIQISFFPRSRPPLSPPSPSLFPPFAARLFLPTLPCRRPRLTAERARAVRTRSGGKCKVRQILCGRDVPKLYGVLVGEVLARELPLANTLVFGSRLHRELLELPA